ncbi:SLAM family member 5-like [Triplophysa dalaica]|uniref:SLAM family member 5-like n=1 Tax=Triplophysa dalaica TaxID=1582913 RepID=UPI0024E00B97|nr:SLAM family member 5-like [Triplophysa dalaica]XP_056613772.1 SLAM family member 5-like [Triplophysa dalaica]XP_056613773.1 SLAM family member 5-like [Triplophysa dalaica]XP_056613774.1 SLAM family member 5-like [Triplophysa dalaica]
MKDMAHTVLILLFLLKLLCGVSCDGENTVMHNTHNTEIPAPEIIRDYPPCEGSLSSKCLVACSVSNVADAQLSWYNGSKLYSSLRISDLNKILYLVVEYDETNNYSCMVSSSGISNTSYANISSLCHSCLVKNTTTIQASEGGSVTLPTYLTELKDGDDIMWFYEHTFISEFYRSIITYHDCNDGRFYNRLQLDGINGSLTIRNLTKSHSGTYKLKSPTGSLLDHNQQLCQGYNIVVFDTLPIPVITNDSTQCSSSSSSKCVLLCSVNVTNVSLSWYNGSRLNSSISVSDLKRSNFLCLEVEYQDTNTYSCVVNNPFTNKTTPLDIHDLCKEHIQDQTIDFKIVIICFAIVIIIIITGVLIWCCCRRRGCASQGHTYEHI